MCIYGIELLIDNIAECRANLLEIFADYLNLDESNDLYRAASYVLSQNLVHGDALTMRAFDGQPITFALGRGKFQRRDFRFDVLAGSSAFSAEGSLFARYASSRRRKSRGGPGSFGFVWSSTHPRGLSPAQTRRQAANHAWIAVNCIPFGRDRTS